MSSSTLSVKYTSTVNPHFSIPVTLTPPSDTSVQARQTYLASLRDSISSIQDQVNKELTTRMEEDNKRTNTKSVNDEKEEENYGEEVVSEDE
ncbi:hypothetical protein QBC42DRAFT_330476 [Cladorrhinum samala]|uniref:EKC/KEOPS complex subunit GON7 n=1 Tax=Cladorrhinum samala TaxID=585594 RepID=A0AAV9HQA0_9PEZI|nr:hypothetical protein QBC42DRAFT_330476 [Cladorrhinum samala]